MSPSPKSPLKTRLRGRIILCLSVLVGIGAIAWASRGLMARQATAKPAMPTPTAEMPPAPTTSDYVNRVVAYVYDSTPVTRQELGEYLILRYGFEKLPLLLNKRIVDDACRQRGIEITAAEVEAALAEDMRNLAVDRETFLKSVLTKAKKNLIEWKEDVLRPRLQMSRLVSSNIEVTNEDLRKAYESTYGEKVECRVILWRHDQQKEAMEAYGRLRDNETAFAEAAKAQPEANLASTGGKIKPITRHSMEANLENEAFKLQPGQVSTLLTVREGIMLLKCDKRTPADTSVNFEAVRPRLTQQVRESRLQQEMAGYFTALRDKARPQPVLTKTDKVPTDTTNPSPTGVVAYLHGSKPVTREELGEFLIQRYGAEKLEFFVNRMIIDRECAERGIGVTDEQVEAGMQEDLKLLQCDAKVFEKQILAKWGKNIFEYREDIVRPRLLMLALSKDRAKCTPEDLQKCYDAHYGERRECRIILWPPEQKKYAMSEYAKLRDSEEEFARAAKNQASATLAGAGGKIPVFGRNTLGDDAVEKAAFDLQPNEVSTLIETPQGHIMIKCDQRIAPDEKVKLEQVREQLHKEVMDKKIQVEMQLVFKELAGKAKPRLILRRDNYSDVAAEAKSLLSEINKALPPTGTK